MPAINFQPRWPALILNGTKTSTIRKLRTDERPPCKVGDSINCYTGMRTKQCKKFATITCIELDPIKLWTNKKNPSLGPSFLDMYRNGWLATNTRKHIAEIEGFGTLDNMAAWFIEHHQIDKKVFTGWQIQWEAL